MVTNYYKKYIKYKNKYLQYKSLLHGGTTIIEPTLVFLASHQNAITVFLMHLIDGYAKTRKKFKNCMCLCIARDDTDTNKVKITMIYEGELDTKDKSKDPRLYFTTDEFNSRDYKLIDSYAQRIPQHVKIFLVRHGNGPHNAQTGLTGVITKLGNGEVYTDPLLTPLGIQQAERASVVILQQVKKHIGCKVFVCSSRLRRAIQTAAIIMTYIEDVKGINVTLDRRVIVIPGVEEIVDDKGNTEKTLFSSGLNPENRSICEIGFSSNANTTKKCDKLLITEKTDPYNRIEQIVFDDDNFVSIDSIGANTTIPVDFTHMQNNQKTIFPIGRRIDTAFNIVVDYVVRGQPHAPTIGTIG